MISKSILIGGGVILTLGAFYVISQRSAQAAADAATVAGSTTIAPQSPVVSAGAFDTGTTGTGLPSNVIDFAKILEAQVNQAAIDSSTAKTGITSTTNTDLMQRFFANAKGFIGKTAHISYSDTGAITGFDITNKPKVLSATEQAKADTSVAATLQSGYTASLKAWDSATAQLTKVQTAVNVANEAISAGQTALDKAISANTAKPTAKAQAAVDKAKANLLKLQDAAAVATNKLTYATNYFNSLIPIKAAGAGKA